MNSRSVAATVLAAGMAFLGGCASTAEQGAFSELGRSGRASGAASTRPAEGPRQTDLPEKADLSDYLSFAALHNPGLEAAFARWKAALERIPQARSPDDPRFTYRHFIVAQAMRDGDMRNTFEISQMFPWFGKLELRGDIATREARAAQQRFEMERLKLYNRVKQAYYEHYYLSRAIAVAQENVQQLKHIEDAARARYAAAAGSQADLIRAQVELGKLENELRSLEDLRGPTVAKLNAALNRPADAKVPTPGPIAEDGTDLADRQLSAWLSESNPELKGMDFDVAREKLAVELARKDYFPDVMVGFEIDQMSRGSGMTNDEMNPPLALMVSLNIPIWWEKYAAGVREAKARYWAAQRDKTEKANSLGADLKMAAYNCRNAQRKIALYRDTLLPKARQSLKSIQVEYQTGKASFTDLIDAQRILLEFQLSHERALADRQQALAEMEMIVGRPLSGAAEQKAGGAVAPPAGGGKEKGDERR